MSAHNEPVDRLREPALIADYVRWPVANINRRWHFVWQVGEAVGHRPVRWWWIPDAVRATPDWLRHRRSRP